VSRDEPRGEPLIGTRFHVDIEGLPSTGATAIVFPDARIVATARARPTVQYGPLTLRRGMTGSGDWYGWWDTARAATGTRRKISTKTVAITLLDRLGAGVNRWTFSAARPIGYAVSPLDALHAEVLIESLELSVSGFRIAFGGASSPTGPTPKT
jgi:phage tail-like protein